MTTGYRVGYRNGYLVYCEKCNHEFKGKKYLKQHLAEKHSY